MCTNTQLILAHKSEKMCKYLSISVLQTTNKDIQNVNSKNYINSYLIEKHVAGLALKERHLIAKGVSPGIYGYFQGVRSEGPTSIILGVAPTALNKKYRHSNSPYGLPCQVSHLRCFSSNSRYLFTIWLIYYFRPITNSQCPPR